MFCSFLSPIRTTKFYDQSTNATSNNSYINETLSLQCSLYIKNEKLPIQQISENCSIYMKIINEKAYEYSLNIKSNKKGQNESIQIIIDKECSIFRFTYNFKNKCIMIYKNQNLYILGLLKSDKEEIFLEKLEILKISSNLKLSIHESIKEQKMPKKEKYIINYGNITNINSFIDNFFQKNICHSQIEENDISMDKDFDASMNNSYYLNLNDGGNRYNNFISKKEFMKNFFYI